MATRGIVGFVVDGQEKLSYNHFDSYPSALGVKTLEWLRGELVATTTGHVQLRQETEEAIRVLQMVDEKGVPTPEQFEQVKGFFNGNVGSRELPDGTLDNSLDWYQALRGTQGNLYATLDAGFAPDSKEFPLDSLFCEWGYIIDLDAERFDTYVGFRHEPPTDGRWAGRTEVKARASGHVYYPVQRILSVPFSEVAALDPATFIEITEAAEDDD